MLPKNNKPNPAMYPSGEDSPAVLSLTDFTELCHCDFKVQENRLMEELNDRYTHLQKLRDLQITEYDFMLRLVQANSAQLQGQMALSLTLTLEQQLAALGYDNAGTSLTLKYWRSQLGERQLIILLCDIINYFLYQFEVKEKPTEVQIMQLSCKLLAAQPHLRILELVFVLQQALHGHFGQTYARIGLDTLLGWLNKFYHHSADYLEGKMANNKTHESRGTQPWVEEEKNLARYRNQQLEKKRICDTVWQQAKELEQKTQQLAAYKSQHTQNPNNPNL